MFAAKNHWITSGGAKHVAEEAWSMILAMLRDSAEKIRQEADVLERLQADDVPERERIERAESAVMYMLATEDIFREAQEDRWACAEDSYRKKAQKLLSATFHYELAGKKEAGAVHAIEDTNATTMRRFIGKYSDPTISVGDFVAWQEDGQVMYGTVAVMQDGMAAIVDLSVAHRTGWSSTRGMALVEVARLKHKHI